MNLILSALLLFASTFSKSDYFEAMSGNDQATMSSMLTKVQKATVNSDQKAYLGAIKMRASTFKKTPKEKLASFKSGQKILESVITANPKNVEYRFLRLIVQENAPKVLKYNAKIKEDAKLIKAGYQKVTPSVKQAIVSYDKKSVNLNL
jgi:hypothetical protein